VKVLQGDIGTKKTLSSDAVNFLAGADIRVLIYVFPNGPKSKGAISLQRISHFGSFCCQKEATVANMRCQWVDKDDSTSHMKTRFLAKVAIMQRFSATQPEVVLEFGLHC
jgi:hypothetical protein